MKLKNRFYNDYLKSLVLTQGSTEPRSTESKQMQELIYMNNHIQRFYNGNYFSYAVFENSKEVRIKHIYKAIENAKNIYEDAKKKALIAFKEEFKDMLEEENVDLKA